jgi:hypothetical protein
MTESSSWSVRSLLVPFFVISMYGFGRGPGSRLDINRIYSLDSTLLEIAVFGSLLSHCRIDYLLPDVAAVQLVHRMNRRRRLQLVLERCPWQFVPRPENSSLAQTFLLPARLRIQTIFFSWERLDDHNSCFVYPKKLALIR